MDNIEKTLQELFDEMLTHVKGFRRKTYNGVFEKGYMKYRPVLVSLEQLLAETEDEEQDALIEKLSQVIPAYAYDKMQKEAKKNRERLGVDYNMNMAVYVIPSITTFLFSFTDSYIQATFSASITPINILSFFILLYTYHATPPAAEPTPA